MPSWPVWIRRGRRSHTGSSRQMLICMRTTINLPDALAEAAAKAAAEGRTFTSVVEEGLRIVLALRAWMLWTSSAMGPFLMCVTCGDGRDELGTAPLFPTFPAHPALGPRGDSPTVQSGKHRTKVSRAVEPALGTSGHHDDGGTGLCSWEQGGREQSRTDDGQLPRRDPRLECGDHRSRTGGGWRRDAGHPEEVCRLGDDLAGSPVVVADIVHGQPDVVKCANAGEIDYRQSRRLDVVKLAASAEQSSRCRTGRVGHPDQLRGAAGVRMG